MTTKNQFNTLHLTDRSSQLQNYLPSPDSSQWGRVQLVSIPISAEKRGKK